MTCTPLLPRRIIYVFIPHTHTHTHTHTRTGTQDSDDVYSSAASEDTVSTGEEVGEGKVGQTYTSNGDDFEAEGSSGESQAMCSLGEEKGDGGGREGGTGGEGEAEGGRGRVGEKELTWEA
jgi:hypothetical protein